MDQTYSIVKDANGFRVIFADASLDMDNYDQPQHRSEESAGHWAQEILSLEMAGRE